MRFYLSSYKMGKEIKKLKEILPENKRTAYISNALDYSDDIARRKDSATRDKMDLEVLGLNVENLDLRHYFGKEEKLEKKIKDFGVIWVRGGNAFVLRQAMRLSGFDNILQKLQEKKDMLYGGYSAGICILSPTLKGIDLIDDPKVKAYGEDIKTIWTGLSILDYSIVPHHKSGHYESENADKAVAYMHKQGIPFKALRDGEVIII